jgi:hypothetical protein
MQACTGWNGTSFACFDRHADLRLGHLSEPDPASFEPASPRPDVQARHTARKFKLASADRGGGAGDAIHHAAREDKPTPTAANPETLAWVQRFRGPDPIITKAKTAVAAKLENPASAVFDEMNRAVRKNTLGQSVDCICGRVKSKRASGDENEARPFLYLVKDGEAFVVDDSSASASMAYHAICK